MGTTVNVALSLYWAKAGDGAKAHPVICHLIDVGNVVLAFLERPAAAALRARLARELDAREEEVVPLVAFLAAAHDIGKVSAGFQMKREDLWKPLEKLGFRAGVAADPDHGRSTLTVLKRSLRQRGCEIEVAFALARSVAAHHGAFVAEKPFGAEALSSGAWREAQDDHVVALEAIFRPEWKLLSRLGDAAPSPAWLMSLAGLTSVCDWLGSAEEYFPYEPDGAADLEAYAERSQQRAREAVRRAGFTGFKPLESPLDFHAVFGFSANEMQEEAVEAAARLSRPGLLIIEAPMGLGKTEAALASADVLLRRHRHGGVYYALPTQATSNQMFGRLTTFLKQRCEGLTVDLHLLHGLSDLNEDYRELRLAAVSQDPDATVRASSWFTASKRGLLAPFGVGTIDQALLAAMSVRHMFVRMVALADKVVILDEVHAYDTYMSEILDHLVSWLAALGSSVIVLSATLPTSRRRALVEAYGAKNSEAVAAHYPQLCAAEIGGTAELTEIASPPPTTVKLERLRAGDDDATPVALAIAGMLADGGCAAWICNTVEGAQRAFQAMRKALPDGCEHLLFHARFPVGQRLEIEKKALSWFGKQGHRPARAVLVATQVVEQSLDLDFDVMVSDLAPVDLMLQRAGRLHRHPRPSRPAGLQRPTLLWVEPPMKDDLPVFGVHEYVYERLVLLRSWLALRERTTISLPGDVPKLVESVYSEEPDAPDPALRAALLQARADFEKGREEDQLKALGASLSKPTDSAAIFATQQVREDDESAPIHSSLKAQTRLTRPSVTVICATQGEAGLQLFDGSPLDMTGPPDREAVRALRRAALTLQRWEWVRYLTAQATPAAWKRAATLQNCRLAVFDGGWLSAPGLKTSLELSRDLGLVVHKLNAEGQT